MHNAIVTPVHSEDNAKPDDTSGNLVEQLKELRSLRGEVNQLKRLVKEKELLTARTAERALDDQTKLKVSYELLLTAKEQELANQKQEALRLQDQDQKQRMLLDENIRARDQRIAELIILLEQRSAELGSARDELSRLRTNLEEARRDQTGREQYIAQLEKKILDLQHQGSTLAADKEKICRELELLTRQHKVLLRFPPLKLLRSAAHLLDVAGVKIPKLAFLHLVEIANTYYMGAWERKTKKRIFP